ncbi:MAG TPA: hypothetical protein VHV82_21215 [Sporichthyaceae bacterium]|nr:hypothetical protein [Sporichthyaceae bacterium]
MVENPAAARLRRRTALLAELQRVRNARSHTATARRREARRRAVFHRALLLP